jgi:hypothetical protein
MINRHRYTPKENTMNQSATQGPAPAPRPPAPFDFARFDRIMHALETWRSADHEDTMWLHRNHVIEIIEGVKALKQPNGERASG